MNLYDVSGNLCEWTSEATYDKAITYGGNMNHNTYSIRGGGFYSICTAYPACYRMDVSAPFSFTFNGFRPALYLQQSGYLEIIDFL